MLRSALLKSPRSIYISGSIVSPSRGRKDLALSYTSSKPTMHHRMSSLCFSVSGLQVPIKKAFGLFLAILHSFNSSQQTLKIMKGPNIAVLCDFYFKEQGEQAMSSFSLSTQNYRCLKNRGLALCRNAFGTAWCLCVSVCLRHLSAQNNHVSALRFLSLAKFSIPIFISRQLAPTPKCQPYDPFKISCESSMFVRVGLWQHDLWQLLYTSSNLWNARNKIRRYGTMKPSQIQKYLHRHFRLCLNRTLSSQDSHIEFLKLRQSLLMFLSSPCGSRLERLSKLQYGFGGQFSFSLLFSIPKHTHEARMLCVYVYVYEWLPLKSRPLTLKYSNRVLNIKTTEASLDVVSVARLCSKTLKPEVCIYIYFI